MCMNKIFSFLVVGIFAVVLGGCFWQEPAEVEYVQPEVTMEDTMNAAELTPEEAQTQVVSEDDEIETIESELDATVILEEDLSNL